MKNKLMIAISKIAFVLLLSRCGVIDIVLSTAILLAIDYLNKEISYQTDVGNNNQTKLKVSNILTSLVLLVNQYVYLCYFIVEKQILYRGSIVTLFLVIISPIIFCIASYKQIMKTSELFIKLSESDFCPKVNSVLLVPFIYHFFYVTFVRTYFRSIYILRAIELMLLLMSIAYSVSLTAFKAIDRKLTKINMCIIMLVISYLLSFAVNGIFDKETLVLYDSYKVSIYNAIFCALYLYYFGRYMFKNRINPFSIFAPIFYIWSIVLIPILVKYLLGMEFRFISVAQNFSINSYYNIFGSLELVLVLIGCGLVLNKKRNILAYICIGINLIALAYSNSRTSYLLGVIGIFLIVLNYLYFKKKKIGFNILVVLLTLVLCLTTRPILFRINDGLKNIRIHKTPIQENTNVSINKDAINNIENENSSITVETIRPMFDETTSTLTGRTNIWRAAIKGYFGDFKAFVFGVTNYKITPFLVKWGCPFEADHCHNIILEVFCDSGFLAGVSFLALIFVVSIKSMKRFIRKDNYLIIVVFIIFGSLLLSNMAESFIFYAIMPVGFLFFYLLGYLDC